MAVRDAVSWNGRGRPASSRASTSPSSTNRSAGRARATDTTSGSRSVITSSDRVATITSSSHRWTWIRIPSSLVSTDTECRPPPALSIAAATEVALDASIGWTGRPTSSTKPASASADPDSAAEATATVEPAIIAARRTASERYAARGGQSLLDEGVEGTLAHLAGDQPAQPALLVGGRPAEQGCGRLGPGRLRAGTRQRRRSRSNASCTSRTVRDDSAAGSGSACIERQPRPVRRCRSEPAR